eukprot:3616033-Rhodomonas_salina.1
MNATVCHSRTFTLGPPVPAYWHRLQSAPRLGIVDGPLRRHRPNDSEPVATVAAAPGIPTGIPDNRRHAPPPR